VFYVAYTTGDRKRPVTFLYNGGPGSASLWLHIGAFGPRRIVTSNTSAIPPGGGKLIDNPSTLLDTSDLVFIDPVGTGFSSLTGKGDSKDFWGVDEDIRAFSQFIRRWVAANDRGASPKFLLGESYGTFRSAGLVDRLQNDGMSINGVILLSSLLDYADDFGNPGDENVPDAFAIPSEAAVACITRKCPIRRPTSTRFSTPHGGSRAMNTCRPSCARPARRANANPPRAAAAEFHRHRPRVSATREPAYFDDAFRGRTAALRGPHHRALRRSLRRQRDRPQRG